MKKEIFVSNTLPDIRKKLSQSSVTEISRNSSDSSVSLDEETDIPEKKAGQKTQKEFSRALELRYQEFSRLKRDVIAQITSCLSSIPQKIEVYEENIEKLSRVHARLKTLIEDLTEINEKDFSETTVTELGQVIKKVENARLEFLRISGNITNISTPELTDTTHNTSLLPEILSLSVKQLMKLGFAFFFPVIIAILAAAFILGIIILFAMGG